MVLIDPSGIILVSRAVGFAGDAAISDIVSFHVAFAVRCLVKEFGAELSFIAVVGVVIVVVIFNIVAPRFQSGFPTVLEPVAMAPTITYAVDVCGRVGATCCVCVVIRFGNDHASRRRSNIIIVGVCYIAGDACSGNVNGAIDRANPGGITRTPYSRM